MIESDKIFCKKCKRQISMNDKICPYCKSDLSKVGRHFEVTLRESLKMSDEIIKKATFKWDPNSLTLLGIFITIFLTFIPLLKIFINLYYSILLSFLCTVIILLVITKINFISNFLLRFLRWLIK